MRLRLRLVTGAPARVAGGVVFAVLVTSVGFVAMAPRPAWGQGGPVPAAAARPAAQQEPSAERAVLERRLREGYARLLRRELRLTDDQAERLRALTAQFDAQRRPLFMRERRVREQLREQLGAATPDNGRVSTLLDALMQLNRQRLDLLEAEQRELAAFLNPVQRARYLSLQENFRRRLEEQRGRERVPGSVGTPRGRRPAD